VLWAVYQFTALCGRWLSKGIFTNSRSIAFIPFFQSESTTMKLSAIVFVCLLSLARAASAQSTEPVPTGDQPTADSSVGQFALPADAPARLRTPPVVPPAPGSFLKTVGRDTTSFFSPGTAKILGTFAVAGLAVMHWDNASVEDTSERLSKGAYTVGNIGGSLYVQAGASLATYAIGRATGTPQLTAVGGDLMRAQILSQLFVQGAKFAVARQRPDGSNSLSFPSGHSASAFATATVVQDHFGWKAGIPAYTFASFVAASRLGASKHYLSDVVVGAGIGIAAGRTVTLRFGGEKFALGAAPTAGGAVVTFSRR
jgi:membrane-associated phospholipid phosphatase